MTVATRVTRLDRLVTLRRRPTATRRVRSRVYRVTPRTILEICWFCLFFFNHRDAATVHLETHRNYVLHGVVCDFTLLSWS
jgi:hypothetical protein